MPYNVSSNTFDRVWQFVDQFEEFDDIKRSDLDTALDDLNVGVNLALQGGMSYVGDWIASGAFPTKRPDLTAIHNRDAWRVSVAGTVGGISFIVDDYLVALRGNPGTGYAGNWFRVPKDLTAYNLALTLRSEDAADAADTSAIAAAASALTASSAASAISAVVPFVSIAAMQAFTTPVASTEYTVCADGVTIERFVWNPANVSAQITASDQDYYAPASAPSGASGAYQRSVQRVSRLFASKGGKWVDDSAALTADTSLTYTNGATGTVVAGDYVRSLKEGFSWQVAASTATDHSRTTAGGVKLYVMAINGQVHLDAFGPKATGLVGDDDTAILQKLVDHPCPEKRIGSGVYSINGSVTLRDNITIVGTLGASILYQRGQYLWVGPNDLDGCVITGIMYDFVDRLAASETAYWSLFKLKAHNNCRFGNSYFQRYNQMTVFDIALDALDTTNCIDNIYEDWHNPLGAACQHFMIVRGYDPYEYKASGTGDMTPIATNIIWPETYNSSVMVVRESSVRRYTELVRGTDYTVAYDGSNKLTVIPLVNRTVGENWIVYTANPEDTGRRPVSNITLTNIDISYVDQTFITCVRWVDEVIIEKCRLVASSDNVDFIRLNPYTTRGGEGGDHCHINFCTFSYILDPLLVTNHETIRMVRGGPGSYALTGIQNTLDFDWMTSGGLHHGIAITDTQENLLPITISTNGTSTVTAGSGSFRDWFTAIGTPDRCLINGVEYSIATIGTTTMTLGASVPGTASGVAISRKSFLAVADNYLQFANMGTGFPGSTGKSGMLRGNSTGFEVGSATILSGNAYVDVPLLLWRAPKLNEIAIMPGTSGMAGFFIVPTEMAKNKMRVQLPSAAGTDQQFSYKVEMTAAV